MVMPGYSKEASEDDDYHQSDCCCNEFEEDPSPVSMCRGGLRRCGQKLAIAASGHEIQDTSYI
jgi:hypothetical protein